MTVLRRIVERFLEAVEEEEGVLSKTTRGLNQSSLPTNKESKSERLGCEADLVCEFF
jgi:hypothetical protein